MRDVEMTAVQEKEKEVKVEETEKKNEDEKDDPTDDGRTLLSAGWGAGHDGSAFEILGVWVEGGKHTGTQGNNAHSRTIQNRAQRLAEYGARRAELGCGPFPSTTTTTCTSPLCPAGRNLKRRTRPWERASPPTKGVNGSVLGVVWEVDEGEDPEKHGGREDERSRAICACVAALGKDRKVLRGRSVVCGFGGCVGWVSDCFSVKGGGADILYFLSFRFKHDADAVRRVLFPEPEPLIPDDAMVVDSIGHGRRVHALQGPQTDEVEEDGERPPPRKRRRVSGLEDVYAAAFEGERARDEDEKDQEKGERQEEEEEEGKMVVETELGEGEGKAGGKGAEKEKEQEKDKEGEAESAQAPQEESLGVVVKEQPIEKEKPKVDMRDVQLTTADGNSKLLVFSRVSVVSPPPSTDAISPSAPPATTSSSSPHPQDESRWDVARVEGDGTREVLHRSVGKDQVEFAEAGVRFRVVVGGKEVEGMAVDGDAKMNSDADENWGERIGVVLWRYGS
ncbi:hypothetical protein R3P38DRAFT_1561467 [Favolaschia claudopus]|uniref:Uncharacterized protein n=1 Tax=Favolaschia claudopus TaxID=2862362 RepID=A0AAW0AII3_9AGAR